MLIAPDELPTSVERPILPASRTLARARIGKWWRHVALCCSAHQVYNDHRDSRLTDGRTGAILCSQCLRQALGQRTDRHNRRHRRRLREHASITDEQSGKRGLEVLVHHLADGGRAARVGPLRLRDHDGLGISTSRDQYIPGDGRALIQPCLVRGGHRLGDRPVGKHTASRVVRRLGVKRQLEMPIDDN